MERQTLDVPKHFTTTEFVAIHMVLQKLLERMEAANDDVGKVDFAVPGAVGRLVIKLAPTNPSPGDSNVPTQEKFTPTPR